jgi:hypothetical protein
MTRPGRPKATAPRGRVTMAEAGAIANVSKSAVQRRIAAGDLPARTEPDGVVTIARKDVKLIVPRAPADGDRVAVQLRGTRAQHEAWTYVAQRRGLKVSVLAMRLLDDASGWRG